MNKKERIEALVNHFSGGNSAQFANKLGIAPSTLSSWKNRESIDYDLVFAKCENLSPKWLISGEGEMFTETDSKSANIRDEVGLRIPVYEVDFSGGFSETFNDQTITPDHYISVAGFEKADCWCRLRGDSMSPEIKNGDLIALRECDISSIVYGNIYAVVMNDLRTVKKIRKSQNDDYLRFIPINKEEFDEQEYHKREIIKVFEVIGNLRKQS